jgi:hypothetical protein
MEVRLQGHGLPRLARQIKPNELPNRLIRHCEEQSDEAIQSHGARRRWIASLRSQ